MTLKEEACSLINQLPDKCMEGIIRQLKRKMEDPWTWETPEQERARKMEALQGLQELRKQAREYEAKYGPFDPEAARAEAMREKFGL